MWRFGFSEQEPTHLGGSGDHLRLALSDLITAIEILLTIRALTTLRLWVIHLNSPGDSHDPQELCHK